MNNLPRQFVAVGFLNVRGFYSRNYGAIYFQSISDDVISTNKAYQNKNKPQHDCRQFVQNIRINLKHFVTFLLLTSKITIKEKLGVGKSKACLHRFYFERG